MQTQSGEGAPFHSPADQGDDDAADTDANEGGTTNVPTETVTPTPM